nr:acyltransferase family protein [Arthrobacter sp. efr-133-TYG-118]
MANARTSGGLHPHRLDIQGLRALAVGLVVAYHLRPDLLPGGFVGVDVFFVISGFLIIGSLVREASTYGRIDLTAFYGRRIRRLLPASTAVLLATVGATVVLIPSGRWQPIAIDVVMSALQVQNWNQAFGSVSYESATAMVSPVQHFWSLAVEEQFYIFAPLLLTAAALFGVRTRLGIRGFCILVLVLVTGLSFGHSVHFSVVSHDIAYFASSTRVWELGLGGLTALCFVKRRFGLVSRAIFGWLGLLMIALAALFYTTALAFPGYVALLPVLGAVLFLVSGAGVGSESPVAAGSRLLPGSLLSTRPVRYLGDISYSLYLWHWPIVVFGVHFLGRRPGLMESGVLALVSLAFAVISYRWIEQRFRHGTTWKPEGGRRYRGSVQYGPAIGLGAVLVMVTCLAAAAPWGVVEARTASLTAETSSVDYPGALAFGVPRPAPVPADRPVIPDPALATRDVPLTFKDGCGTFNPSTTPDENCFYGDLSASRTIVIVGDSHASQYVDPMAAIGSRNGWKIKAMVRNGCPFTSAPPASQTTVFTNCSEQNKISLRKILEMAPSQVVISAMQPEGYRRELNWGWKSDEQLVAGYSELMRPLVAAGIKVSVILDTPLPPFSAPDCLQQKGLEVGACMIPEDPGSVARDPLRLAAEMTGKVEMVDLHAFFCRAGQCPSVIGNVLVYRDNHITNTFARTLASPLEKALGLDQ